MKTSVDMSKVYENGYSAAMIDITKDGFVIAEMKAKGMSFKLADNLFWGQRGAAKTYISAYRDAVEDCRNDLKSVQRAAMDSWRALM